MARRKRKRVHAGAANGSAPKPSQAVGTTGQVGTGAGPGMAYPIDAAAWGAAPTAEMAPAPKGVDPVVTGSVRDIYLANQPAQADVRAEYATGGSRVFPLAGQITLTQGGDDLAQQLGLKIYETMLTDSAVWAAWSAYAYAVLSGEFQAVPKQKPEEGESETWIGLFGDQERYKEIQTSKYWAEFIQRNFNRTADTVETLSFQKLFASVYGVRIFERTLEPGTGLDKKWLVLKSLKMKANAGWNFVVDPFSDVVALRCLVYGGGLMDLPPEKFSICTWFPRDRDPRGYSMLRPAYNPWNLKLNFAKSWYKFLDRFGVPSSVAIAPPATEMPQKQPAQDMTGKVIPGQFWTSVETIFNQLRRMYDGACAAFPNGTEVQIHQAQGEGKAFDVAMNWCDEQIIMAIVNATRMIREAEHGSKADSETAVSVVKHAIALGRKWLARHWHDLAYWLMVLNPGEETAEAHCPEISLGEVKDEEAAEVIKAWTAAGYVIEPSIHLPQIDAKLGLKVRDIGTEYGAAQEGEGASTVAEGAPQKPAGANGQGKVPPQAKVMPKNRVKPGYLDDDDKAEEAPAFPASKPGLPPRQVTQPRAKANGKPKARLLTAFSTGSASESGDPFDSAIARKLKRGYRVLSPLLDALGYKTAWVEGLAAAARRLLLGQLADEGAEDLKQQLVDVIEAFPDEAAQPDEEPDEKRRALFLLPPSPEFKSAFGRWATEAQDTLNDRWAATLLAAIGTSTAHFGLTARDISVWRGEVHRQEAYWEKFRHEILTGQKPRDGTLPERASAYGHASWQMGARVLAERMRTSENTYERNQLGVARHCHDCPAETARGWVPIGDLIPIGDRACLYRCRCWIEYGTAAEVAAGV